MLAASVAIPAQVEMAEIFEHLTTSIQGMSRDLNKTMPNEPKLFPQLAFRHLYSKFRIPRGGSHAVLECTDIGQGPWALHLLVPRPVSPQLPCIIRTHHAVSFSALHAELQPLMHYQVIHHLSATHQLRATYQSSVLKLPMTLPVIRGQQHFRKHQSLHASHK